MATCSEQNSNLYPQRKTVSLSCLEKIESCFVIFFSSIIFNFYKKMHLHLYKVNNFFTNTVWINLIFGLLGFGLPELSSVHTFGGMFLYSLV